MTKPPDSWSLANARRLSAIEGMDLFLHPPLSERSASYWSMIIRGMPLVCATFWYLTAGVSTMPSPSCSTMER